jgi:hypothetical protein
VFLLKGWTSRLTHKARLLLPAYPSIMCPWLSPSAGGGYAVAATASGVDQGGGAIQINLTAYAFDADDAQIAVAMIEAEVVNEPVIPDGAGAFTTPQHVTAISVEPGPLAVSQLVFKREAGFIYR